MSIKNFCKIAVALFLAGNIFAPFVHAEVKTYTGVGDYVLSDDTPPGDVKNKARMYAERDALSKAGVFVSGLTEVKKNIVSKDEIVTIIGGILKVSSINFEVLPLNDASGIAKYRATIIAEIDTNVLDSAIKSWLNRTDEERANLVEQNKSQQKTIDDLKKRIAELENLAVNVKTQQDKETFNQNFAEIDKETLSAQKVEEGWKFFEKGNYNSALKVFGEAVTLNPKNLSAYYGTAYTYDELKNYQKAVEFLSKAVEIDSTYFPAYSMLGYAQNSLKNYQQAISYSTKAIQLNSNYKWAYHHRGYAYNQIGEYNKAIADFDKVIQLDANYKTAYLNRGVSYEELKNYNQAIADYSKAIQLDSNYKTAYFYRALISDDLKNYNQAIADYNKAIQLDSKDEVLYNNLGWVYYNLKNYQEAIKNYSKAIQLKPDYQRAYNNRGNCYLALGENEKAQADFEKAKSLKG